MKCNLSKKLVEIQNWQDSTIFRELPWKTLILGVILFKKDTIQNASQLFFISTSLYTKIKILSHEAMNGDQWWSKLDLLKNTDQLICHVGLQGSWRTFKIVVYNHTTLFILLYVGGQNPWKSYPWPSLKIPWNFQLPLTSNGPRNEKKLTTAS